MKPRGAVAETDKPKQESSDERDLRMEARYTYDRQGERSTLVFVDRNRDDLVQEFFAWRQQQAREGNWMGESVWDALRRWERTRFGADLFDGAHGLLRFGVSIKLDPSQGGRRIPPGYFDRAAVRGKPLPSKDADVIAAMAARGHRMPHVNPSRAQRDAQMIEAHRQAEALRAEAAATPKAPVVLTDEQIAQSKALLESA